MLDEGGSVLMFGICFACLMDLWYMRRSLYELETRFEV